jgi:hypothetical protein
MTRTMKHGSLSIRQIKGASTTPSSSAYPTPTSSAYPSAYPSENEDDTPAKKKPTFPFLSLPSELRNKIYSLVFSAAPSVLDLDPSTFSLLYRNKILALFAVCRQIHLESTHNFFSTHTIRLFPTYPGRYFKTKRPLLARLPKHYRASITTLELRLGPGWNNPPRGWVVNDGLGLKDCVSVRVLKVFVECDPSDVIFKGFRAGEGFYEKFAQALLEQVLQEVPNIQVVEFDAWNSVKRTGDMISGLGEVVAKHDKIVGWGPERGWQDEADHVCQSAVLLHGGKKLSKSVAVFA